MTTLRQALEKKLTKKEKQFLISSFDVIGDIAVIQIHSELKKKEKLIAQTLLNLHKNIKVVAKEIGGHEGIYRIQKVKVLAGERRKETEYKESNARMKLNVEKTYFSPRYSTERLRIAKQVKKDEEILVMFSGIAPFPLIIAKNAKPKSIVAVELNPDAHKYALENITLNKLENTIKAYKGDVRLVVPRLGKKFDRIAMPLPVRGENFLDVAIKAIKKNGIIHFYDFSTEDNFSLAKRKVKKACFLLKKKCRILRLVKCGQQKPRVFRICVDVKVY